MDKESRYWAQVAEDAITLGILAREIQHRSVSATNHKTGRSLIVEFRHQYNDLLAFIRAAANCSTITIEEVPEWQHPRQLELAKKIELMADDES